MIPTGAHTPSSQKTIKGNSAPKTVSKRGGAQVGHIGKGRKSHCSDTAHSVETIAAPLQCLECGDSLAPHGSRYRSVLDAAEMKAQKKLYEIRRGKCRGCGKISEPKLALFPRALYSNRLTAQVAIMHYLHGVPIGRICEMLGSDVNPSGILAALHRTAKTWEPAIEKLIAGFRASPVKHADETGWRIDGQPGWAWLFCTPSISIVECRETRASIVPKQIFGQAQLPGVLVVDRSPCASAT